MTVDKFKKRYIIIITEPDTPLNDADHVGSFNLYGSEKMELKKHQVPMTIDEQVENHKVKQFTRLFYVRVVGELKF